MHLRTTPYTPAASSVAYPCGSHTVRLLPGATMAGELNLTRARLGDSPIDGYDVAILLTVLAIAALWDDPEIELDHRPAWADNLLIAPVGEIRTVGLALIAEIHGRGTRALGLDPAALVTAASEALSATGESPLPSGPAST